MDTVKNKLTPASATGAEASSWKELVLGSPRCPNRTCNRALSLAIILFFPIPPPFVLKFVLIGIEGALGVESSLSNMRGEATAVVATRITKNRLDNVMSGDRNKKLGTKSANVLETRWRSRLMNKNRMSMNHYIVQHLHRDNKYTS